MAEEPRSLTDRRRHKHHSTASTSSGQGQAKHRLEGLFHDRRASAGKGEEALAHYKSHTAKE